MTREKLAAEIKEAIEQLLKQYNVFSQDNRIPEFDEAEMLKGKVMRLYDRLNRLQIAEEMATTEELKIPPTATIKQVVFEPVLSPVVNQLEKEIEKLQEVVHTVQTVETDNLDNTVVVEVRESVVKEVKTTNPADVQAVRTEMFKEIQSTIAGSYKEEETIHDKFGTTQAGFAVADKLKLAPVADLIKAIGLNEKFLFISELFNNDQKLYQQVLEKLNTSNSFADAYMYFDSEVVMLQKVDKSSPAYALFLDLLQRRFL
jgi:hypothetical protein